jgi:hypothetical protein
MVHQAARRLIPIASAQFPPRTIAIGVDRCLGHAKFTRYLFRTQVTIDQTQAFTLPWGQAFDGILSHGLRLAHKLNTLPARAWRRLDSIVKA